MTEQILKALTLSAEADEARAKSDLETLSCSYLYNEETISRDVVEDANRSLRLLVDAQNRIKTLKQLNNPTKTLING